MDDLEIGLTVIKKSGKPFKYGIKEDVIERFDINPQSPTGAMAAFLTNSQTYVNVSRLTHKV